MAKIAVAARNLDVKFGDFYAVHQVSFTVQAGKIFGFLGANGAGKTTTIRVLCGLLIPTAGEVDILGIRALAGNENAIKQQVGYMSQRFTLYEDLTVAENLEFAASLRELPVAEFIRRRDELLNFIGFKQPLSNIVANLPGGLKQEIALVAAIIHDPAIIFLDEPTAGVAPVARAKFWELIKQLAARGKTIFVTTHYMDEAENWDEVALMRTGELIALDSPTELKKQTFKRQLYHLTPNTVEKIHDLVIFGRAHCELFEPYGQHFHLIVREQEDEAAILTELQKFGTIRPIMPSLEDVFVKLVEGTTR